MRCLKRIAGGYKGRPACLTQVTVGYSGAVATRLTVASVPANHSYVKHIVTDATAREMRILPDPPVPGAPAGQWWPHRMLEPDWLRAHSDRFDLLHVHFGYEDRTPEDLRAVVELLRRHGKPLVVTVHDLRNPHQADPRPHRAALDVLVPAADAVITLTEGAAAHIAAGWGRTAEVIAHPLVVDSPQRHVRRAPGAEFLVGVHAKSVRANCDAVAVARELHRIVADLPDARLVVRAHDDPRGRAAAAELTRSGVPVEVGPRFCDDELFDHLAGLDVSVLPHRFGTHSGWLETCFDLGTTVIAPDCGHYAEQAPCLLYRRTDAAPDAASLAAAVRFAHTHRPLWRADPARRRAQRAAIAEAHLAVYRAVSRRATPVVA
jgi:hypothetical protein